MWPRSAPAARVLVTAMPQTPEQPLEPRRCFMGVCWIRDCMLTGSFKARDWGSRWQNPESVRRQGNRVETPVRALIPGPGLGKGILGTSWPQQRPGAAGHCSGHVWTPCVALCHLKEKSLLLSCGAGPSSHLGRRFVPWEAGVGGRCCGNGARTRQASSGRNPPNPKHPRGEGNRRNSEIVWDVGGRAWFTRAVLC